MSILFERNYILKRLSKLFDVSINTLLGSPGKLICQYCGMPLEDCNINKETDGFLKEEYCKWCYADGKYTYESMNDLIDFCAEHI
ncbi:MAG: zinc ribbon domain-containing protein [Lachnospiraceae bacterium]|nr:zinc ribbon domain-containing protein [Lachnospiraceae bacterium]